MSNLFFIIIIIFLKSSGFVGVILVDLFCHSKKQLTPMQHFKHYLCQDITPNATMPVQAKIATYVALWIAEHYEQRCI